MSGSSPVGQRQPVLNKVTCVSPKGFDSVTGLCRQQTSNRCHLNPLAEPLLAQIICKKKKKKSSMIKQHKTELFPPFTLSEFDVFGWKASPTAPFDQ